MQKKKIKIYQESNETLVGSKFIMSKGWGHSPKRETGPEALCQRMSEHKKFLWHQGHTGQPPGAEVVEDLLDLQDGVQLPRAI